MKLLVTMLLLAVTGFAQDIEYGKPSELQGITRVFIDVGLDGENRQRIIKEIEKAKLGITILDSAESAQVVLKFDGGKEDILLKGTSRAVHVGKGVAFVPKANVIRVLFSMEGSERKLWDDKPATNFGKMFVKEFKKANGLK